MLSRAVRGAVQGCVLLPPTWNTLQGRTIVSSTLLFKRLGFIFNYESVWGLKRSEALDSPGAVGTEVVNWDPNSIPLHFRNIPSPLSPPLYTGLSNVPRTQLDDGGERSLHWAGDPVFSWGGAGISPKDQSGQPNLGGNHGQQGEGIWALDLHRHCPTTAEIAWGQSGGGIKISSPRWKGWSTPKSGC